MKKKITILGAIIISLSFFTSCGTWRMDKTSDFAKLNSIEEIEGIYFGRSERANYKDYRNNNRSSYPLENNVEATNFFVIKEHADFITISFESKDRLKITYYNDTVSKTVYFDGKFKGKFFEVYHLKKQIIIPLIYSQVDIWRLRIGKTKEGKLLVRDFRDLSGNFLVFGGGTGGEDPYRFHPKSDFSDYMPTVQNNKWGYADAQDKIIIPCIYDYTSVFERDVARVKQDGKWVLIDKQGQKLTPFSYDYIFPIDTLKIPLFQVKVADKWGIINTKGQTIVPPIYDIITYNVSSDNMVGITLGEKHGYASLEKGVVVPAIYDKPMYYLDSFKYETWEEKRNGKLYQISKEEDGYYETELKEVRYGLLKNIARIDFRYDPIPETKRKLHYDDQFSEEFISPTQRIEKDTIQQRFHKF